MRTRSNEPFLWVLFSSGGVLSALCLPALLFLIALAFPLGWLNAPSHQAMRTLLGHPLTRVFLFAVCTLSLFHWAHRFRYTLYDGLQIKHLNELIHFFCYGGAIFGTLAAVSLLLNFH
jgi:fumarate reductase subunit D